MLSTYIAEVTVGSAPFPFFDPFAILVAVPLYTLHILVLGTLVVRGRVVTISSLFVGGIIFGLYEAYITKVIWNPYWEFGTTVHIAEVAVIQTAILVLWYHNFFAFIIPLAVAEVFCTRSRKVFSTLPQVVRTRLVDSRVVRTLIVLGVAFGMLQAASAHGPLISLVSVGANGLLILALCHVFRVTGDGTRRTIDELLPTPRQFRVLLATLIVFYAVFASLLFPEKLPGPAGHIAVALMYLGSFVLLRRLLRMNGLESAGTSTTPPSGPTFSLSRDRVLLFLMSYTTTATLMGFVPVLAGLAAVCIHVAGVCVGVSLLAMAVKSCIRLN